MTAVFNTFSLALKLFASHIIYELLHYRYTQTLAYNGQAGQRGRKSSRRQGSGYVEYVGFSYALF